MIIESTNIDKLNERFKDSSPHQIIKWCMKEFDDNIAMTSSFQISGIVLIDIIRKYKPDFPVYFIDTRFHFQETIDFRNLLINKVGVNVITVQSELPIIEFEQKYGKDLYKRDSDLCCNINKIEPYNKLRKNSGIDYWISALRKDQGASREKHQIFMTDTNGYIRIHPLINWSWKDVWNYVKENKIVYNPLYNKGYVSIGCSPLPCTNKAGIEDGERSGRWAETDKTECGLHEGLK